MKAKSDEKVTRVVLFNLDHAALTHEQLALLERHAGTARAVWNWALGVVNDHEDRIRNHVRAQAIRQVGGTDDDQIKAQLGDAEWRTVAFNLARQELGQRPSGRSLGVEFTRESRDPESRFAWWASEKHGINRFAVSSALFNLQDAINRSVKGTAARGHQRKPRKDGQVAGWPQFKKRGRSADGFAICNIALNDPWKPIEGGHRLRIPSFGSLRIHQNTRILRRLIQKGGHPKSARFTRHGDAWTVSITVSLPADNPVVVSPATPDRNQRAAGPIGVDLGVLTLAALSDGTLIPNRRVGLAETSQLKRLRRRMERQHRAGSPGCFNADGSHVEGSCAWRENRAIPAGVSRASRTTLRQLSRLEHRIALQRKTATHQLTKRLATGHDLVAIENLNTAGMTAAPESRPDPDSPSGYLRNGRASKAGLNREILRAGFGEIRRQLTYKTSWYGSQLVVIDRWAPTSRTCSSCETVKPKLPLKERIYRCEYCGMVLDRDVNAARNILAVALDAAAGQATEEVGLDREPTPITLHPQHGPGSVNQTPTPGANAACEGPPTSTEAA